MRTKPTEVTRYMECPTHKHRRYKTVAQMLLADNVTWHCTACGKDHYNE